MASSLSFLHCLHNRYAHPDTGFHVTFSPLMGQMLAAERLGCNLLTSVGGDQGQWISVPALSNTGCLTCSEAECLLGSFTTEEYFT